MYYPNLKNWGFFFLRDDGYNNQIHILMSLSQFWDSKETQKFIPPGSCYISGIVYGNYKHDNGEKIITTAIKQLERLGLAEENGIETELFVATTASGSRYYLYERDSSGQLATLLNIGAQENMRQKEIQQEIISRHLDLI